MNHTSSIIVNCKMKLDFSFSTLNNDKDGQIFYPFQAKTKVIVLRFWRLEYWYYVAYIICQKITHENDILKQKIYHFVFVCLQTISSCTTTHHIKYVLYSHTVHSQKQKSCLVTLHAYFLFHTVCTRLLTR